MSQAAAERAGTSTVRNPRWPIVLMAIVTASAFGPYVGAGMRTDQLVIYPLAVLLLGVWTLRPTVSQFVTVGLLSAFVLYAVIHMVFRPALRGGPSIAMLDNLVMPVAVCAVTLILAQAAPRETLLKTVAAVTVVGMLANTLLVFSQLGTTGPLQLGRWRPAGEESVGDRAAQLGRYTGMLNQPALASILYGLAILLAIYLLRNRTGLLVTTVAILTVGGTLGISKAFLFLALPVCLVVLFLYTARRDFYLLLCFFTAIAIALIRRDDLLHWLANQEVWDGGYRLSLMLTDLTRVGGLTGGRLGETGSVSNRMDSLLEQAPFIGLGPGGYGDFPLDTLWLLAVAINGLLGLGIVVAILAVLAIGILRRARNLPQIEFVIGLALVVILIGGAFGYPVLYGDRLAVPLWAVLMLLLAAPSVGHTATDRRVSRHTLSTPS